MPVSNSQSQLTICPSASVEESVNIIVAGAKTLLAFNVNKATGGWLAGGGSTTNWIDDIAVFLFVPSGKPSSVTVRETVYTPGNR